ncbi:MAG: glycine betaine/L-proline ABC transporter ATP-binding protein ProV [Klebsiella pneumoniae]|nr:glycine betaine/L-proline ABC transporter ATP-binding protein ProV [Klebsiella pneumoniae]
MAIKLEIKNLYKIFGEHPHRAFKYIEKGLNKAQILEKTGLSLGVKDASLAIEEGEIFVIMGLSGSGKSTMVRLLNRLIEPTRGQVLIDGVDIAKMSDAELREVRRKKIAMVFQSFALMPHMSVLDNTAFGMALAGVPAAEREQKAREALRQVGLENYAHAWPDELSGGMRQRVGLARALAINPDILLMDEAFSALDPLIRTEMQDELIKLQAKHQRTIVFISHDLDEAMRIGDRIAIMQNGEVVQVGTPDEILNNPTNDYVRTFFRGVDISQVFSAKDIARRSPVGLIRKTPGFGPRSALKLLQDEDREYGYVIERGNRFVGIVSIDSLKTALSAGQGIEAALIDAPLAVEAQTPLSDLLSHVGHAPCAVPVVDEEQQYIGIISKRMLLQAFNGGGADWLHSAPAPQPEQFNIMDPFHKTLIPLDSWVTHAIDWIVLHFRPLFQGIRVPIDYILSAFQQLLLGMPAPVAIIVFALIAWQISSLGMGVATLVSLIAIGAIGAWSQAMVTLALVLTALLFCMVIGLPLGIWLARSPRAAKIIRPLLDAMQTTPAFVYLVPIVMLFGIGNVPGVVVTIIFALPPIVRLTILGINQVPADLIEASRSFGASPRQLLFKVQLPLAMPTIMAGVNQTLMLALSMVVIASMIAVGGLGQMVLRGIGRLDMGLATVGGVGIVILAIILDRLTQAVGRDARSRGNRRWYTTGPLGLITRPFCR